MSQKIVPGIRVRDHGRAAARKGLRALLDLLLPGRCRRCGKACREGGYCTGCAAGLARHACQCQVCGQPLTGGDLCGRCQYDPPPVAGTIAPFKYAPPISANIHGLKYHRKLAFGRDLGCLLAGELEHRAHWMPEALVPVPLHWKRQFRRGFNQSVEISRPVSRRFGIPLDTGLVERQVHTVPQVGLAPAQRRANLRRAFRCSRLEPPSSVAIVDDVITSGSTVSEVAHCLRRAGVERIVVWALTRV